MPMTDELAARIAGEVAARRDDAIAMLRELVAIPSVTGDEAAVQDAIERLFRARELDVDRWEATREDMAAHEIHVGVQERYAGRPNLAATRRGAGGGQSILLNAHIDTVDNGDPELWTHDPNGGEVVDGLLYGRGACDMKGGLVTHLLALDALAAAGVRLRGDVTVVTSVGEENGGIGALSAVLRGHRADAALITEPTKLAAIVACEGSLMFRLTVRGKSAHAAVRDEGVSALEKFIPLYEDLMALERERNARLDHPLYAHLDNKVPINVGVVRAGTWASTVPETLVAECRVGYLPGETLEAFRAEVEARIAAAAARDPWLREHPPEIELFGGQFTSAETSPDAPIVRALRAAHARVTGSEPPVEGATYGADMRHFVVVGGMPTVMYGAGDVEVAHHADEHIAIDDLLTAATTIAGLLVDWCGVAE